MPVRSLNSPVLIWPDAESVDLAARRWAEHASQNPEVVRIGYFGSYARGD
jgi:predicted nucleotidyltransferase